MASSFFCLGLKFKGLLNLKQLLPQQQKLRAKVQRAALNADATDLATWLGSISKLVQYVARFELENVTGAQLTAIESDEPLSELGMYSDLDRKYLLLQLARVRARQRAVGVSTVDDPSTLCEDDVTAGLISNRPARVASVEMEPIGRAHAMHTQRRTEQATAQ